MILAFQMMLLLVMCLAIPSYATLLHPIGAFILHSHRHLYIHARLNCHMTHGKSLMLCGFDTSVRAEKIPCAKMSWRLNFVRW